MVKYVFDILEKNIVKRLGDFRYVVLSNEASVSKFDITFLTLEKIANLFLNIYQELTNKSKSKA